MEDEDRFGSFWDSLDEEEEDDKKTSNALVEQKPMLPKNQYTDRTLRPRATNSIKIERKTGLDYMIRKNQQLKMRQKEPLPTYNDYQQPVLTKTPESAQKPVYTHYNPPIQQPKQSLHQPPKQTQQPTSLYPRYHINEPSKPAPESTPSLQNGGSYLRSQMVKELQTQQHQQSINISKEKLQPPTVQIPPRPIKYSQLPNHNPYQPPPIQSFTSQPKIYSSYYDEPESTNVDAGELVKSLQNIHDKTKIDVIIRLLDGDWHTESELIRIAKKTRDFIGVVGFGMLMCSLDDTIAKSFLIKRMQTGTQFKINENYIELARSAYSQYKLSDS
jgi:hypothetical protein